MLCTIIYMATSKFTEVDGHIRGKQIDIEFNEIESNKPKELKLHHVTPLPQQITNWCFVILSIGTILSNFLNIVSSLGVPHTNSTWTWKTN